MVERITADQALQEVEKGNAVLLDVRTGSWDKSDVKAHGAHRIPPKEAEIHLDELPKDKEIITYCT